MPASYGISRRERGLLSWRAVTKRLALARNYWVVTADARGRPHAVPVWGLWLASAFYFATDPASRKGRNLAARPDVVVHLESGDDAVILEGVMEPVHDARLLKRFADAYEAKYAFRPDTGSATATYRLRPKTVHAWHEAGFPQSATRWRSRT